MKKTCITKIVAFCLALVTCFATMVVPTMAEGGGGNNIAQPYNIAVATTTTSLTVQNSSTKTLKCYGSTTVTSAYKAKVIVELQRYESSGWVTISTWTSTGTGMVAAVEKLSSVSSGTYRLKTTHQGLNSSGSVIESIVKYSNVVTVP